MKNNSCAAEEALKLIQTGAESCVAVVENAIVYAAKGRGVSPLVALYQDAPQKLSGAFVLDAVIGKAAAVILILGGAKRAYGKIMSAAARDYLTAHGVAAECGSLVENITNRSGDGLCPLEKSVADAQDPAECLERLLGVLNAMAARRAGGNTV